MWVLSLDLMLLVSQKLSGKLFHAAATECRKPQDTITNLVLDWQSKCLGDEQFEFVHSPLTVHGGRDGLVDLLFWFCSLSCIICKWFVVQLATSGNPAYAGLSGFCHLFVISSNVSDWQMSCHYNVWDRLDKLTLAVLS